MKVIIIILLIITVVLFGLDLFSDFLEISFLKGKYKWIRVAYFSLLLLIPALQNVQNKKQKGSSE